MFVVALLSRGQTENWLQPQVWRPASTRDCARMIDLPGQRDSRHQTPDTSPRTSAGLRFERVAFATSRSYIYLRYTEGFALVFVVCSILQYQLFHAVTSAQLSRFHALINDFQVYEVCFEEKYAPYMTIPRSKKTAVTCGVCNRQTVHVYYIYTTLRLIHSAVSRRDLCPTFTVTVQY